MVGALHQRKNPLAVVQAFSGLKADYPDDFAGAELHLKCGGELNVAIEALVPKLRVHKTLWPPDVLRIFYGKQHCLVSASKGEGKNMPALEMMSTGGVVIAPAFGGHTMWMDPAYAYPLRFDLVPDHEGSDAMCAKADVEHLKELMMYVYKHRAEAKQKGELASRVIPAACSWDSALDRLMRSVAELHPHGQQVRDKLLSCRPVVLPEERVV
jgi:glycosyltransferase involved in cell wall biosynthesis